MKKRLLAIVFICVTSISWSQINEIGVFIGGTNYIGDVGKTNYISPNKIGASLIYKYNLNPRIALRGNLSIILCMEMMHNHQMKYERTGTLILIILLKN